MHKKITFGLGDAYITDYETKNKIINWVYNNLDLSKHRYVMLNGIPKLKFLQDHPHFVAPNFKGFNYLLIMTIIDEKKYCVVIDRKKLSYHKEQLDMKTIQVIQLHIKSTDSIFRGTIFDGKLIQTNNNNETKYVFLIQDCFLLMGNKVLDIKMSSKMEQLDTALKAHLKKENGKPCCNNFDFKLNKLYVYDELEEMIKNLATIPIPNNGIMFFPMLSGINVLHIEKKIEKVEMNTYSQPIEQKSYHIINDFIDFLKSRTYAYEAGAKMKHLWLSRTEVMDVYDIADKENGDKQSIALIPNLKTSQMCDKLIGEEPVRFNCMYSNKFKKWIPLEKV